MRLAVSGPSPQPRSTLVVWPRGRAFLAPGAKRAVDLSRRAPASRIVELLARRRHASPGDAVTLDEIVSSAWPGERMHTTAAFNRAYVALATLRKLGLRDVLVTGSGGYWLSPAVTVRFATDEERLKED
jgi:hypothetical protein